MLGDIAYNTEFYVKRKMLANAIISECTSLLLGSNNQILLSSEFLWTECSSFFYVLVSLSAVSQVH